MEGVPAKILGRARSRLLTYSAPARATLKKGKGGYDSSGGGGGGGNNDDDVVDGGGGNEFYRW